MTIAFVLLERMSVFPLVYNHEVLLITQPFLCDMSQKIDELVQITKQEKGSYNIKGKLDVRKSSKTRNKQILILCVGARKTRSFACLSC